ncbi:MAG: DUF2267 domain-containing protein [Paracoccaceae bacterium]
MTLPNIADRTIDQTQNWLHRLQDDIGLADENQAYVALRAVLHQTRDRLPTDEATDLGAQLPTLVRGIYYEAWKPTATPEKERHAETFVERVRERMHDHPQIDAEAATRSVFALLAAELDSGEIDEVIHMMHDEIKPLWPSEAVERSKARKN